MYKNPEQQKEFQKDWYQRNKESITRRNKERRNDLRYKVREWKILRGCERCGYNKNTAALDIHHKSGKSGRENNISQLCKRGFAWQKILAVLESDEIILLCANCHREEHY